MSFNAGQAKGQTQVLLNDRFLETLISIVIFELMEYSLEGN